MKQKGCGTGDGSLSARRKLQTYRKKFSDAAVGILNYNTVLWAMGNKVITESPSTTFNPSEPCTRAQVVTFWWRVADKPNFSTHVNAFIDVKTSASSC